MNYLEDQRSAMYRHTEIVRRGACIKLDMMCSWPWKKTGRPSNIMRLASALV